MPPPRKKCCDTGGLRKRGRFRIDRPRLVLYYLGAGAVRLNHGNAPACAERFAVTLKLWCDVLATVRNDDEGRSRAAEKAAVSPGALRGVYDAVHAVNEAAAVRLVQPVAHGDGELAEVFCEQAADKQRRARAVVDGLLAAVGGGQDAARFLGRKRKIGYEDDKFKLVRQRYAQILEAPPLKSADYHVAEKGGGDIVGVPFELDGHMKEFVAGKSRFTEAVGYEKAGDDAGGAAAKPAR